MCNLIDFAFELNRSERLEFNTDACHAPCNLCTGCNWPLRVAAAKWRLILFTAIKENVLIRQLNALQAHFRLYTLTLTPVRCPSRSRSPAAGKVQVADRGNIWKSMQYNNNNNDNNNRLGTIYTPQQTSVSKYPIFCGLSFMERRELLFAFHFTFLSFLFPFILLLLLL